MKADFRDLQAWAFVRYGRSSATKQQPTRTPVPRAAASASGRARTRAAIGEPLFNPVLAGEQSGGLAQLISSCIRMRDRDGALEST